MIDVGPILMSHPDKTSAALLQAWKNHPASQVPAGGFSELLTFGETTDAGDESEGE